MMPLLLQALGVGFVVLAIVAAFCVVTSRAHFATTVFAAGASVMTALALLCFGAGAAALAVALAGVGVVPVLMLGGVLLSGRSIRGGGQTGAPRLTVIAAVLVAAALLWATQDATPLRAQAEAPLGIGAWLAALLFATGLTCAGALGYGERGALMRRAGRS
ncbi:MAG: hypothetical protein QM759_00495 [Terricaulis sp.]